MMRARGYIFRMTEIIRFECPAYHLKTRARRKEKKNIFTPHFAFMAAVIAEELGGPLSYLREVEGAYGVSKLGLRPPYGKAAAYVVLAAIIYAVIEQVRLLRKRQRLPGPRFAVPFVGCLIEMVVNTANFWDRQRIWAMSDGGLS